VVSHAALKREGEPNRCQRSPLLPRARRPTVASAGAPHRPLTDRCSRGPRTLPGRSTRSPRTDHGRGSHHAVVAKLLSGRSLAAGPTVARRKKQVR